MMLPDPGMLRIIRTDSVEPDFVTLVKRLDAYLAQVDGSDHAYYAQFNKIESLNHVVVIYEKGIPVACGAIKECTPDTAEIKRMYTTPECRGKGFATLVLCELEAWAAQLSFRKCILETGRRQVEAIGLYKKNGYKIIPNYGPYAGIDNSICFEKRVIENANDHR